MQTHAVLAIFTNLHYLLNELKACALIMRNTTSARTVRPTTNLKLRRFLFRCISHKKKKYQNKTFKTYFVVLNEAV